MKKWGWISESDPHVVHYIFGCYNQIASDLIPKEGIRLFAEDDNQIMLLGFSNLK